MNCKTTFCAGQYYHKQNEHAITCNFNANSPSHPANRARFSISATRAALGLFLRDSGCITVVSLVLFGLVAHKLLVRSNAVCGKSHVLAIERITTTFFSTFLIVPDLMFCFQ